MTIPVALANPSKSAEIKAPLHTEIHIAMGYSPKDRRQSGRIRDRKMWLPNSPLEARVRCRQSQMQAHVDQFEDSRNTCHTNPNTIQKHSPRCREFRNRLAQSSQPDWYMALDQ
jgi:hypothetical protein